MTTATVRREAGGQVTGRRPYLMLGIAAVGFALNFWAWALLSPLGAHFKQVLALTSFQQALIVAVPVIVGALGRILLLLGNPAAVEQHDAAIVGRERRDDLQADLVLEAAGGKIEFLVVHQAARHPHAAVLVAQRVAAQQLVERDGRRRLVHPRRAISAAAAMIGANFSAVRLAPPTSAPSTFSTARIFSALAPVTDPP